MLNTPDDLTTVPDPPRAGAVIGSAAQERRSRGSENGKSREEPWTLRECIQTALEHNPGLESARWDLRSAEESRDIARSAAMPDLHVESGYSRYVNPQPLTPVAGDPGAIVASEDIFEAHLRLQMPLYTGGRIRNNIAAAELRATASEATRERRRKQLVFDVSSIFYEILARRHVIESLESNRKALEKHLEQVKIRIANDRATKVERLRTEVRLADVRQELADARNTLETRRQALATLVGIRHTGEPPEVSGELTFEDEPTLTVTDALDTAYEQRDDYRALRAKVEAQKRRVSATRAELWPTVSLQGSYGVRWDGSETTTPEDVGSAGIGISLPVFEGGAIRGEVRKQVAELEASRERLREFRLGIRLEVRKALNNVESARERIQATEKSIEQAEESLRAERLRYRNGKASITDVLDAQAALLQSQKNYYRGLAAWKSARLKLRLATGRAKQGVSR